MLGDQAVQGQRLGGQVAGVLSGLVWPQIRVEIEVTAVIPAAG